MSSPSQHLIRLGFGFMVSQALNIAADFNIADRLAAGQRSVEDLAAETGCHAEALYRVMRVLAAEGVFRETLDRRFELTELGSALRSDHPSSPRDMIRMMNREPYLAFAELGHSVGTSLPAFEKVFGKPRFDWLADHPDEAALFQHAMISLSQGSNEAVAAAYDFGPFARIVDVGGGHGRNCRDAMKPHGRVLVAETIIPPGNEPTTIKLIDAAMLVVTGGVERTEAEYAALFATAGLRLERVVPTGQPISILEASQA